MKSFIILIVFSLLLSINLISKDIRNGGENGKAWHIGDYVDINYNPLQFNGNVNIKIWNANLGKYMTIKEDYYDANGLAHWLVPFTFSSGSYYKLRVESASNPSDYQLSENFFTIHKRVEVEENDERTLSSSVYPNPTSFEIYLKDTEQKGDYVIINTSGTIVQSGIYSPGSKIALSNLSSGKYTLRFTNSTRSHSFIINK